MTNFPLPRLDKFETTRKVLLPFCRLKSGEIWHDPAGLHKVGCLDATDEKQLEALMSGEQAKLAIQDPPYNLVAFDEKDVDDFIIWCEKWVDNTNRALVKDSSFYVWLGADQKNDFQPLPDFMLMMRKKKSFQTRSFITMRNQRGYGTQKNWMAVRQELLYYIKGDPIFDVNAEYTDIPKILKGYYKEIDGKILDNLERSHSDNIRAANVWVDIQQVFYRMEENVNGCYAQKPLKCINRIIKASSQPGDLVLDFFAHAGTTLLAAEIEKRKCYTIDIDPVFCEITIRRIENYRKTGKTGWQNLNPFYEELAKLNIQSFDEDGNPSEDKKEAIHKKSFPN